MDELSLQDSFDQLLGWLDPDRERAGEKYEHIRQSLIKIFVWRGCTSAEDLADETINRVMKRVPDISATFVGDPALYFYGVAKKLILEYQRRSAARVDLEDVIDSRIDALDEVNAAKNVESNCLKKCLRALSPEDRGLLLQYYGEGKRKVRTNKQLAAELGITPGVLRARIHKIRVVLHACIMKCKQEGQAYE